MQEEFLCSSLLGRLTRKKDLIEVNARCYQKKVKKMSWNSHNHRTQPSSDTKRKSKQTMSDNACSTYQRKAKTTFSVPFLQQSHHKASQQTVKQKGNKTLRQQTSRKKDEKKTTTTKKKPTVSSYKATHWTNNTRITYYLEWTVYSLEWSVYYLEW